MTDAERPAGSGTPAADAPPVSALHPSASSVSRIAVPLSRPALRQMLALVRLLHRLTQQSAYRALVYPLVPVSARFDPGHDAVMMGYDFHVTADGPHLIEVNTNAGGFLPASAAACPGLGAFPDNLPGRTRERLLASFAAEFAAFSRSQTTRPRRILIVDEDPPSQFLHAEMRGFASLLADWGVTTALADPAEVAADEQGVFWRGEPVDLIYNRHCDFYLETAAMAGLRAAYLAGKVCLTPNPHTYGLLADKRRLALWSDPQTLAGLQLPAAARELCQQLIPSSQLLADMPREQAWEERKKLVFKPVTHYGSKGVLLGTGMSRRRFEALPAEETLVQQLVPPALTESTEFGPMKTDLRLYAYRDRLLGITARLYRGQVTNMRTPGGGFAAVQLV
ncbi:MAG: hypothetical protein RQ723_00225 [Desulfuromonadales bacterium]|nr:hypothetical protein [Desulfuromonadales bacterium]